MTVSNTHTHTAPQKKKILSILYSDPLKEIKIVKLYAFSFKEKKRNQNINYTYRMNSSHSINLQIKPTTNGNYPEKKEYSKSVDFLLWSPTLYSITTVNCLYCIVYYK